MALIVAIVAFFLGQEHGEARDRAQEWRSGGDAVDAAATIEVTSVKQYTDLMAGLGTKEMYAPRKRQQIFIVQISWTGGPEYGRGYTFFLLDPTRTESPKALEGFAAVGADGVTGSGSDGSFDELADHYSWLEGVRPTMTADGRYNLDARAVYLPADAEGSGVLSFALPSDALLVEDPTELILGMALMGDGYRWAKQVPLSAG